MLPNKILSLLIVLISSSSLVFVVNANNFINQLAVLLRARPPWPTTFPSGTSPSSSSDPLIMDDTSVATYESLSPAQLEDFSRFNDLLTGQSLSQLTPELGMAAAAAVIPPIIAATSHPLPQLEFEGGPPDQRAILLAHPVLGPNPSEPPENMDHKFNNVLLRPMDDHLYSPTTHPTPKPLPSAVRAPKDSNIFYPRKMQSMQSSFQMFADKYLFPTTHRPKLMKFPGPASGGGNFKMIPGAMGQPPPGAKVIAIPVPVPKGSPLLRGNGRMPQIFAVKHPFPPLVTSPPPSMQMLGQYDNQVTRWAPKFSPSPVDVSAFVTNFTTTTSTTTEPPEEITSEITSSPAPTSVPSTEGTTPPTTTVTMATTTTTTPSPSSLATNNMHKRSPSSHRPYNNIQDMLQTIDNNDKSVATHVGAFGYPDPPTKPKMISLNTHYEQTRASSNEEPSISTTTLGTSSVLVPPAVWTPKSGPHSLTMPDSASSSSTKNQIFWTRSPKKLWKSEKSRIATHGNPKLLKDFKPSLQLHSFEDTTSGLREYITLNPPTAVPYTYTTSSRNGKSLSVSNSDLPAMESGFRPFNAFAYMNGIPSASVSSTTESSMMNKLRNEFTRDIVTAGVWSAVTESPFSRNNHGNTASFTVGASYNSKKNLENTKPPLPSSWIASSSSNKKPVISTKVYRTKSNSFEQVRAPSSLSGSTASTEVREKWVPPSPRKEDGIKLTPKWSRKMPSDCNKFKKFGFCPVTGKYPLRQIETISSRCTTLLSHLIAPLPQTDVRYDVIVNKSEGSSRKGKSWNWKTFAGKPICDTKEVKVVPGFAKNEDGEWHLILQTEKWKQEAQITLCSQQSEASSNCPDNSTNPSCQWKCVQRFTAQRLVVLDPEDPNRCPVVRSVFLPSACVCLNNNEIKSGSESQSSSPGTKSSSTFSRRQGQHEEQEQDVIEQKEEIDHMNKGQYENSRTTISNNNPGNGAGGDSFFSGRSLLSAIFGLGSPSPSSSEGSRETVWSAPDTSRFPGASTETVEGDQRPGYSRKRSVTRLGSSFMSSHKKSGDSSNTNRNVTTSSSATKEE